MDVHSCAKCACFGVSCYSGAALLPGSYCMKYCPACHKTYPGDYNVCPADQTGLQMTHELQPGMIIRNKYEILAKLGVGGMGVVYKVRHLTFNELYAVKIVNETISGDTNFLQRFQKEAVVTRKLRHPNAVRVDDFDYTDDGRPFIVMELVEGKNIGEVLQSEGPLRIPRAIHIARQVAQALGMAHKLGIVHRDIKPGNILLTTDEQGQETAKVLDFGIAKLRDAVGETNTGMTMTGMVVGTPLYMSPEQFMGKRGGEVDGRTDLYSLGVVLYQMVTAQLPFEGDTLYSLMMQHMQGTVRPPHELVPELHIPESLSLLILKSIDKSREQRFQTAGEFIAGLDQVAVAAPDEPVASDHAASIEATSLFGSSQASTLPARTGPATAKTPPASALGQAGLPLASSAQISAPQGSVPQNVTAQTGDRRSVAQVAPTAPIVDSMLVKSAEQHVLIQPRTFRLKHFLILAILSLAAVFVAGAGYLKYESLQRTRIESAVNEKLSTAPSPTLRQAAIAVSVSPQREVILNGNVPTAEDSTSAETLAGSVAGVSRVTNRLKVFASVVHPQDMSGAAGESVESLIQKGSDFMDAGDYASAIDCLRKAPSNNKGAQDLLERAQRAQKTEEELLKKRR